MQVLQVFTMTPDEFEAYEKEPIMLGSEYKSEEGVDDDYFELVWGTLVKIVMRTHRFGRFSLSTANGTFTGFCFPYHSGYIKDEEENGADHKLAKRLLLDLKAQLEAEIAGEQVQIYKIY